MVTEVLTASLRVTKNGARNKMERLVEITGKDLIEFAAILEGHAADARAKGEHSTAQRLARTAAQCRRATKFTYRMPAQPAKP